MLDKDGPIGQIDPVDDPVRPGLDVHEPALPPPLVEPQPLGTEQGIFPVGANPPTHITGPGPPPLGRLEQALRGLRLRCLPEQPAHPFALICPVDLRSAPFVGCTRRTLPVIAGRSWCEAGTRRAFEPASAGR